MGKMRTCSAGEVAGSRLVARSGRRCSTVELVFGYGKYRCLGKTIAAIELNNIFAEVCFLISLSLV